MISTPCLKKKRPTLDYYNFDTWEWILIFLAEMLLIDSGVFRGGALGEAPPPLALASRRQKGDAGAWQHNITK